MTIAKILFKKKKKESQKQKWSFLVELSLQFIYKTDGEQSEKITKYYSMSAI